MKYITANSLWWIKSWKEESVDKLRTAAVKAVLTPQCIQLSSCQSVLIPQCIQLKTQCVCVWGGFSSQTVFKQKLPLSQRQPLGSLKGSLRTLGLQELPFVMFLPLSSELCPWKKGQPVTGVCVLFQAYRNSRGTHMSLTAASVCTIHTGQCCLSDMYDEASPQRKLNLCPNSIAVVCLSIHPSLHPSILLQLYTLLISTWPIFIADLDNFPSLLDYMFICIPSDSPGYLILFS